MYLNGQGAAARKLEPDRFHLRATTEWETLLFLLAVAHLYGDCNPAADLISRKQWAEFCQLCALLGIRPRQVPLSPSALALIDTAITALRKQALRRAHGSGARPAESSDGRMRISSASATRVGGDSLAVPSRRSAASERSCHSIERRPRLLPLRSLRLSSPPWTSMGPLQVSVTAKAAQIFIEECTAWCSFRPAKIWSRRT